MTRSVRDFAAALASTVLGTAQALHDLFLVREACGAVCRDWQGADGLSDCHVITCDRHAGHRGGHRSLEWGVSIDDWSTLSDHGYDGPRCLR